MFNSQSNIQTDPVIKNLIAEIKAIRAETAIIKAETDMLQRALEKLKA